MNATSIQLRPQYVGAPHPGGEMIRTDGPLIMFCHPAYPLAENLLLALPAYDTSPDGKVGIHHETARIACAIIANCRWDGYFSESADGSPIDIDADGILTKEEYFFRIENDENYAVVPTFSHFLFPHHNLPLSWTSESVAIPPHFDLRTNRDLRVAATDRDISCRVTNHDVATDAAHFVPVANEEWFRANGMVRYTSWRQPTTCDPRNVMLLRKDTHFLFDTDNMVVVPKAGKWVLHVVTDRPNIVKHYHNVPLQPLVGVKVEFILARFAATVLSLGTFPTLGQKRRFWLVSGNSAKVKEVAGAELRKMFPLCGRSTSRTVSNKRQRAANDDENEQEYWPHDEEKEYCLCNTSYDDESPRGRPWKRSFDMSLDNLESDETGFIGDEAEDRVSQRSESPAPKRACLEIRAKEKLEA